MQKFVILLLLTSFSLACSAQYYYKDIISNQALTDEMKLYRQNKIRKIRINSFEWDGSPSEGFFCERHISRDGRTAELYTKASSTAKSLLTSKFNEKFQLLSSVDSSEISRTHNSYTYDDAGRVKTIVSLVTSSDDDFRTEISEQHLYEYGSDGLPVSMNVVKNHKDTIRILFAKDEQGNVGVEKETRSGSKYYYYYDKNKRLTDVVQANEYRENLVAVYIFEYNNASQITKMTTTEQGSNDFFYWRYDYDNALRTRDRLFSKDGKLVGRIEYEYD